MRLARPVPTLAFVAVFLAACGDVATHRPATPQAAETVLTLSSSAYELAYDSPRNGVWFAEVSRGGEDRLWRVDLASHSFASFKLPDVQYNGFTTHVRISNDGAVWVSLPYGVVRVDPATGVTRSLHLNVSAPDELPAATDSASTLAGTWVSDIAVDGDSVLVARLNVPYLTRIDRTLGASRDLPLPAGYEGTKSMVHSPDGWLYLLPGWDRTGPILGMRQGERRILAQVPATRLVSDGQRVAVLSEGRETAALENGRLRQVLTTAAAPGNWTRSNPGGSAVEYDKAAGKLTHRAGHHSHVLQLQTTTGHAIGGNGQSSPGKRC